MIAYFYLVAFCVRSSKRCLWHFCLFDNNWNDLYARDNVKKKTIEIDGVQKVDDKLAVDDNINKNKFMVYIINHMLDN